jgi:hypothetical protein
MLSSLFLRIGFVLWLGKSLGLSLETEDDHRLRRRAQGSTNPIVVENALAGNPQSEWDIGMTAGDPCIQGFATDMSVNIGRRITFKIHAPSASNYTFQIYRLGYYGGDGARYMAGATITATLPQTQL